MPKTGKKGSVCNRTIRALILDVKLYVFICIFVYFVSMYLNGYPKFWWLGISFCCKNHVLFIYTKKVLMAGFSVTAYNSGCYYTLCMYNLVYVSSPKDFH